MGRKRKKRSFLLKAAARTLDLRKIFAMSEDQIFEKFKQLRWKGGVPVCPRCGCDATYERRTRKQWRCKHCGHIFSLTSGTLFHAHKLSRRDYLMAVLIFINAAKGESALQIGRNLGLQHRSAFVLAHKLRLALSHFNGVKLTGIVEIDGCYVGDYDRPANKAVERKEKRKQRRRSRKQAKEDGPAAQGPETEGKQCILALRQRPARDEAGHVVPGDPGRTIARVIASENAADIQRIVLAHVDPSATLVTDEAGAYMGLAAWFSHQSVNHSKEYSADDGTNTNCVESYFSRLRRMEIGQTHKFGSHLELYAAEAAYKEDMRLTDNGTTAWDLIRRALCTPKDDYWNGYWFLHKRNGAPGSSAALAAAA